ncbi:transporter [uncultured Fibrobacter sp.]|uniref:transporter n=1 Tax=uncultured Fibrobacter sp. TaxID=261512 RepID=UPI00261E4824|nr:transporter [uncultured Fibrobacter sp.]
MFKKIAMAAALAATASFATWDYYPVLEAGKGSAEGGLYYDWDDPWSQAGLKIGARYSLIQNLELSLQSWGYQFWGESDCKGCANGGDGLRDLVIGGRYQVVPMVAAFLDINLPIGNDDNDHYQTTPPSSNEIALYFGAQFSMPINEVPGLKFGTEAGFDWGFEHNHYERGLDMHLAGEIGYTVPNVGVTPFVGLQIKYRITESEDKGDDADFGRNDDGDKQINLWIGADYFVIPNQLDLKAKLIVRSGKIGGDASGLYLGAEYFF